MLTAPRPHPTLTESVSLLVADQRWAERQG